MTETIFDVGKAFKEGKISKEEYHERDQKALKNHYLNSIPIAKELQNVIQGKPLIDVHFAIAVVIVRFLGHQKDPQPHIDVTEKTLDALHWCIQALSNIWAGDPELAEKDGFIVHIEDDEDEKKEESK